MADLLVASHNPHKIEEISHLLGVSFNLLTLRDIGYLEDIPETGNTLEENAKIKSLTLFELFGKNVMSDDSGLEIEALNNEPGIFSARYAGPGKNDDKNMQKVLSEMSSKENRHAQFRTVVSLFWDRNHYFFEGILPGSIGLKPVGTNGFGYDPIFIPTGSDLTLAQLTLEQKNKISHRSKALQNLSDFLLKKQKAHYS